MKLYIVVSSSCCDFNIPTLNVFPFASEEKAKEFINQEWQYAITEDYKNEYERFLEIPNQNERFDLGCYEFEKYDTHFAIYENGAYNENHYSLELIVRDLKED